MKWSNKDPRYELDGLKNAKIIIVRPTNLTGVAYVEMKYGWYIHTDFEDHQSIEDGKWDVDWLWTLFPEK